MQNNVTPKKKDGLQIVN